MNILVDTSIWSLALRRKPQALDPRETMLVGELSELIREGRAQMIGVIRQELLSGIRHAEQYERLRKTLRAFPDEPLRTEDFESAARAYHACREQGVAASAIDILICSIAIDRRWAIFSTDPDFEGYAGVLPIRLHGVRK